MSFPGAEGRIASWIAAPSFAVLRENASTPKLSRNSRFQSAIAHWSTASIFRSELGDTYSGSEDDQLALVHVGGANIPRGRHE
jgi:hypothetical protein